MTGEQKPGGLEVAGHFYQTEPGQWTQMNEADGSTVSLTPAEPAEARIRSLEAKLARAVEGLSAVIIADNHRPRGLGTPSDWIRNSHKPAIDHARQTLAALQEAEGKA